jgi:hypothetical protein
MLACVAVPISIVLHTWQTASDVVSNAATVAAICVGGTWAYWRFIRERTRWPRTEVELMVTHRQLDALTVVLHAKAKVRNSGRGLMKLRQLRVDLQRVRPLGREMSASIKAGTPFNKTGVEAAWPLIEQHVRNWEDDKPELEPGESDEFGVDFFIAPSDEVVFVYCYLENVKKRHGTKELGWSVSGFYDLASNEDPTDLTNTDTKEAS